MASRGNVPDVLVLTVNAAAKRRASPASRKVRRMIRMTTFSPTPTTFPPHMSALAKVESIHVVDADASPALAKLFERIGQLTTLPAAAQRIMRLVSDQSANTSDLLAAVEGDPVLAAQVLRRVNSAFYGLRNRVDDLRSAISLLGFREIRNLALTVYMSRMFDGDSKYRGFSRAGLWRHSVAVAHASRLISLTCRRESPDEAYLAGLLHDIGLILLDQYMGKHLMQVVDLVSEGKPTCEAERAVLPFDHTLLGAYLATQWNFPGAVVASTRYHHDPLNGPGDYQQMTAIVAVGDYLCHRAGVSSLGTQNTFATTDAVLSVLKLEQAQLASVWDQLQEALAASEL